MCPCCPSAASNVPSAKPSVLSTSALTDAKPFTGDRNMKHKIFGPHSPNGSATGENLMKTLAFIVLALASASPALPQDEDEDALEEITVTATRREQSVQDVGLSITAYSGEQIRELGFTNTTDIVAMTPGLNYTVPNAESSQINFFLRGVGLNDFADASENPVAVYVDDVYHPASGGLSFQLFDIDRIEVLRGPQGTLFGRNTTGGLVHYVSRKPSQTFDAYIDV